MKKILFSPIGSTDPISGQYDGALLHIIRVYKPDKVYLYLSKEICELEDMDNRYSYCLSQLAKYLDIDLQTEWIRKEELTDVHIFDYFFIEYSNLLKEIYKKELENDDELEMYLNVSSGTPAMKSALQCFATLSEEPLIPIQVATPTKRINKREEIGLEYAVELQWEYNIDNSDDFQNRCSVSSTINHTTEIKKNIIKKHLEAYDYVAALSVSESIKTGINRDSVDMMRLANTRLKLDRKTCDKLLKKFSEEDFFPVKVSEYRGIFEYLAVLNIKIQKEEYADFLRALSPLFFVLMRKIIDRSNEIVLKDFIKEYNGLNNTLIEKWDSSKVLNNDILNSARVSSDKDRVVYTNDYVKIISQLNLNHNIKKLVNDIRYVEQSIRNTVAHNITYVTDEVIKRYTGKDARSIYILLKQLAKASGVPSVDKAEVVYDDLNVRIKKLI